MPRELPPFVSAERDSLIAEIGEAFDGVSREGGISWGQSAVIDAHGQWPLEPELDTRWQDLVDDPGWKSSPGLGGFTFIDEIGFRYYLPVQMTRCVRKGIDDGNIPLAWHLGGGNTGSGEPVSKKWSLLSNRQLRCVKRFVQYMDVAEKFYCGDADDWESALESYWDNV